MPHTVLLTFLGVARYQPCAYDFGRGVSGPETYFSVALAAHLRPDHVISLQTNGAAKTHGAALAEAFHASGVGHTAVSIRDGNAESELWEIFAALTENVPRGCTLHLDITSGFRSLPVLGFIALAYLRATRGITIGGIHYGAYDARDPQTGIGPVFDLTPFLTLLDWTAAADQFLSTGSARRLGDLLSGIQQDLWRNSETADPSALPRKLKTLGSSLGKSSAGLLLLRTGEFAKNAALVRASLTAADTETALHARPFLEVLAPVRESLTRFSDDDLLTLRDLAGWLADRGQTAASLTLSSEWIISYVMVLCGRTTYRAGHAARHPYSLALVRLENPDLPLPESAPGGGGVDAIVETVRSTLSPASLQTLTALASTIRNARNDLNHAGFSESPAPAASLAARAVTVAEQLHSLPPPPAWQA